MTLNPDHPIAQPDQPGTSDRALAAPVGSPVDSAFQQDIGYSRLQINSAVTTARFDRVVDCVGAQGYDVSRADLPNGEEASEPPLFGGAVAMARQGLEATSASAGPAPDLGRDTAVQGCYATAVEELPNPADEFYVWLDSQLRDIDTRIRTDDRVLKALDDQAACLDALGLGADDQTDVLNGFFLRATAVLDEYKAGRLSLEQARSQLDDLQAEEDSLAAPVESCTTVRLQVEGEVRSELEIELLESQGDAIAEQLSVARAALRRYVDYLD